MLIDAVTPPSRTSSERIARNFARMVEDAPPDALDPESSNYLFQSDSAAARGETTDAQNRSMDMP